MKLICPRCRSFLQSVVASRGLHCKVCRASWPVENGIPRLVEEESIRGTDRLLRWMYNTIGRWHDPAVTYLLPLCEGRLAPVERELRRTYMRRLDLPSCRSRKMRILETGIGAGVNLDLLHEELEGRDAEIWGVDLSRTMLRQCQDRIRRRRYKNVHLLMADAQALPFPDRSFDRVFHVGGINGYRDVGKGLSEMARVAKPGTPIVVVDEELDPDRSHTLYHRLMFRLLTFYDRHPHCPTELLPKGAFIEAKEAASRYYYSLTFRMRGSRE